jgi:MFS family permease
MAYLSMFYRRRDLGKRIAFFFTATSLAGAFSGLLAAALLNMDGLGGKPGWAWIFIMYVLLDMRLLRDTDATVRDLLPSPLALPHSSFSLAARLLLLT